MSMFKIAVGATIRLENEVEQPGIIAFYKSEIIYKTNLQALAYLYFWFCKDMEAYQRESVIRQYTLEIPAVDFWAFQNIVSGYTNGEANANEIWRLASNVPFIDYTEIDAEGNKSAVKKTITEVGATVFDLIDDAGMFAPPEPPE